MTCYEKMARCALGCCMLRTDNVGMAGMAGGMDCMDGMAYNLHFKNPDGVRSNTQLEVCGHLL